MDLDNRETIRVLIVDSSEEEAETLLNLFRDAGYSTRAHHVLSMEDLEKALAKNKKVGLATPFRTAFRLDLGLHPGMF